MEDVLEIQAKDTTIVGQRKRYKDGQTLLEGVSSSLTGRFLVLTLLSTILLPTSPAPNPFVQTLLSLLPPSHVCTIGALHLAGSRYLNPRAWSTLPPSSATWIRNHLLHGARSDPPVESELSWTLSKPHLPLSIITHWLFLHLKFWLL